MRVIYQNKMMMMIHSNKIIPRNSQKNEISHKKGRKEKNKKLVEEKNDNFLEFNFVIFTFNLSLSIYSRRSSRWCCVLLHRQIYFFPQKNIFASLCQQSESSRHRPELIPGLPYLIWRSIY